VACDEWCDGEGRIDHEQEHEHDYECGAVGGATAVSSNDAGTGQRPSLRETWTLRFRRSSADGDCLAYFDNHEVFANLEPP
jgi:hypothetical protein